MGGGADEQRTEVIRHDRRLSPQPLHPPELRRTIASERRTGNDAIVSHDAPAASGKPLPLILARELATNLATPMSLMDARGVLVFYNDAAALLIGKPFAEMGEMPAEEFHEVLQLRTPDGQPLRRRDTPSGIAFFQRRPAHMVLAATGYDGVHRLVHATAYPLFGKTSEMHGVVSVFWMVGDEEEDA
jgi:PAS domain-containing protein